MFEALSPYAYRDYHSSRYAYGDSCGINHCMHTGIITITIRVQGCFYPRTRIVIVRRTIPICIQGLPLIPICIWGFVWYQPLYAYGDHNNHNTHMGGFTETITYTEIFQSLTICIMCLCAYEKLESQSPYAKVCIWGSLPIAVLVWGDPECKRAGTGKNSHMGSPTTHNEIVPIR